MSVASASTWAEIISKNSSFPERNNTLYVVDDIDLNNEYPQGVDTLILNVGTGSTSYGRSWTIDGKDSTTGKNHIIRNLRTKISNPVPLFKMDYAYYGSCTVTFKNIDFVNCILSGADFYKCDHSSNDNAYKLIFENCRFVGYRTGDAFLIRNNGRSIQFTSCYVDMPWYAANQSLSTLNCTSCITALTNDQIDNDGSNLPQAYYCWFHESYGGWAAGEANQANARAMTQCAQFCLHGCYIDGNMKSDYTLSYSSGRFVTLYCYVYTIALRNAYTASTPNVIDMHWFTDQTHTSTDPNFKSSARFQHINAVIKKDATIPGASTIDYTITDFSGDPQPSPILATATQMKDISWLRSQGFPILEDTPSE